MPRLPAVWLPCWEHHPWPRPPWPPAVQGFPDAHKFDPDRMGPERKEDVHHAKNFLTFGYGPHYCVGECQAGWRRSALLAAAAPRPSRRAGRGCCWTACERAPPAGELRAVAVACDST